METCIGLFPPNDWAGHRPNCRQITQCDSPIAEAETDTQDRVSIGTAFRDWHQGSLRASIGTLPGNVVGQAFGPREPESLAGLRFVPKTYPLQGGTGIMNYSWAIVVHSQQYM